MTNGTWDEEEEGWENLAEACLQHDRAGEKRALRSLDWAKMSAKISSSLPTFPTTPRIV